MKRRTLALVLGAATAVAGGCGGSSKPAPPVRLVIDAPGDLALLRQSSVEVRGRVSPAQTSVTVGGQDVPVRGGHFSSKVALAPGTNLIDVLAGAPGARPAMVALRVRRQVTVSVPSLTGSTPADAQDALASQGLKADVKKAGGILEFLLPEQERVCQTKPAAGSVVDPGSVVEVDVAKQC